MEAFGLFNFLKSALSPVDNSANDTFKNAPSPSVPPKEQTEENYRTDENHREENREEYREENHPNRFLTLMKEHEQRSKNIDRRAPKR